MEISKESKPGKKMIRVKEINVVVDLPEEDAFTSDIKSFGNGGAHIVLPGKWANKKAIVILSKEIPEGAIQERYEEVKEEDKKG